MPAGHPTFRGMSREDARLFFDRYLNEAEPSLSLLKSSMSTAGAWPELAFDFSVDSLVPVWEYFLAHFTTQPRAEEELLGDPDWIRPTVSKVGFTPMTKRLIAWISYYFAEVMLRCVPQARWGIAKSGAFKNRPILLGFKLDGLHPLHLIEVQAWKAVKGNSTPSALRDLAQVWLKYTT